MQKFQGTSGDGLGALGLKPRDDGRFDLMSVDTVIRDEAPFLRKAGMGGARYMRHCLESVVLERGGLWMPDTVSDTLDMLEKIDGGLIAKADFETWVFIADGDTVKRQATRPHLPQKNVPLQNRMFTEMECDWQALFQQTADQAAEELGRAPLADLWVTRYANTLADYADGKAHDGQLLCALLTRQAEAERRFLIDSAKDGAFASDPYLQMIGARYVRTLCQFDLSADNQATTNPLAPDLTEVGRTILLLAAVQRVPEAMELGARAAAYVDADTLFVPMVPRMALALATDQATLLDTDEQDFGTTLRADCQSVLAHLRGDDGVDITQSTNRIIDGRMRQMGNYSDEYHIDFDDGLSWGMPYEAAGIIGLCAHFKRAAPAQEHAAFAVPTAQVPDLRTAQMPFQDTYAAFLARRSA